MAEYNPPPANAVDFELAAYTPPANNAVDFDFNPFDPVQNTPLNFTGYASGSWQVNLSWDEGNPDQPGDGFKLYRAVDGGAYSLLETLALDTTSYVDSTVTAGHVYSYQVTEYQGDQESPPATTEVAIKSSGDAGTGADALGGLVCAISSSDAGTGMDAVAGSAASLSQQDQGAGTDLAALFARFFKGDSGTGTDLLRGLSALIPVADSGQAHESRRLDALKVAGDQGHGTDLQTVFAQLAGTDQGSGADAHSLAVLIPVQDAGSALEKVIARLIGAGDSGTGSESRRLWSEKYATDQGQGSDATSLSVTIAQQDAGSATDLLAALLAAILQGDTGVGTDQYITVSQLHQKADSGTGADVLERVAAILRSSDAGTGTEGPPQLVATLKVTDAGTGVDRLFHLFVANAGTGWGLVIVPADSRTKTVAHNPPTAQEEQ